MSHILRPMPMSPAQIADLVERTRAADVRTGGRIRSYAATAARRSGTSLCRVAARLVALTDCSYSEAAWVMRDLTRCSVNPTGVGAAYLRIYGKRRGVRRVAAPMADMPIAFWLLPTGGAR